MKLTDKLFFRGVLGVILLFTTMGLVLQGISILFYTLIALTVLYYSWIYLQQNKEKSDEIELQRVEWFFDKVADLNHRIQYNSGYIQQFVDYNPKIAMLSRQAEMGLQTFQLPSRRDLPDLSLAEIEITKLEERSSIILGSLVFIPILFALLHLFRAVTLIEFLLEIIIAINLGLLVLQSQGIKYSLKEWEEVYSFLQRHRDDLSINPRRFLVTEKKTSEQYLVQEIGLEPVRSSELPASRFLFLVIQFLIHLQTAEREKYLQKILESIDTLPSQQQIMEKKWSTYSTRLLMIAVSSTALGALFASLATFRIPLLSTPGFVLETTPYLVWGEYIIIIALSSAVLLEWFDSRKTARWLVILTMVYFAFYWLNSIII